MKALPTFISKTDLEYQERFEDMSVKVESLKKKISDVEKRSLKNKKNLSVRKRMELLLDPESFFLEFSPLAAWDMYENQAVGAGLVTGIGLVSGTQCVIVASDPTIKGGSYFPMSVKKHLRAQEIALENGLPCIYLIDSGGAYLPLQADVFPDKEHFGRIFYNQAVMSQLKIPQISAVLGSCTAGGAYIPAMSDESVIVKKQGSIFLGGPPLVKAATGEEVSSEELGGAEVHCKISGLTDHLAESEEEALEKVRGILARIPQGTVQKQIRKEPREPLYNSEELYGIVPKDLKEVFDMREIISRLVDGSEFDEFKKDYGTTLVTGFSYLFGFPVGIIANNGVLFSESALKATHFIQLCNQRLIPLIFLQNITGFMVGRKYEHEGISKHGAKMVTAVSNAKVPKFTVIIGGSFGAGNYGMCGRAFGARQLWLWPSAQTAVMGGSQASQVLTQIKREQKIKRNESVDEEEIKALEKKISEKYKKESSCYYSTARLWDDGIIDPKETRKVLSLALMSSYNRKWPETHYGIFRM